MEGDEIGGFSEPTMTPGKRALFLLRLILAESNDTWPLLIDQPEDDLDSRSDFLIQHALDQDFQLANER